MRALLILPFVALTLAACSTSSSTAPATPSPEAAATAQPSSQELHFVGPMDLTLTLRSSDNFATATLTDNSDRPIALRSVPAASGVRLSNDDGVLIHFKNGDGVVELVPGRPIPIQAAPQR